MVNFSFQSSNSSQFTTTSTTYVDITSATITIANQTGGKCYIFVTHSGRSSNPSADYEISSALLDDGTIIDVSVIDYDGSYHDQNTQHVMDLNGSVLKQQMKITAGTGYWRGSSEIHSIEVW